MDQPKVIDSFTCYAPSFLEDSSHFPKENFHELYELEKGHFWFEYRNKIIIHFIRQHLTQTNPNILEVGCGTGFVLEGLAKANSTYKLSGTELFLEGLRFARQRSPNLTFFQSDARNLPFKNEYDAVCAFDVIEHIEEDTEALSSIFSSLKPGGFAFISVPQHMWLWSDEDEKACHKRRYTRKELTQKMSDAGFQILDTTSFVFTLLPLMFLSRKKKKQDSHLSEFKISRLTNFVLGVGMRIDVLLIKLGMSLPAGGSLFMVGKKI